MKIKKRILAVLLSFCLAFSLTACGNTGANSASNPSENVETGESALNASAGSEGNAESKEDSTSNTNQGVWTADYVSISAAAGEIDGSVQTNEYTIDITVENNSSEKVGVCIQPVFDDWVIDCQKYEDALYRNGKYYISPSTYRCNVGVSSVTLRVDYRHAAAAGIKGTVHKVDVYYTVYDKDTSELLQDTRCVTLSIPNISDTGEYNKSVIEGATLYDSNGIKIVGQYIRQNEWWGSSAVFYVENNSEQDIVIISKNTSVNGIATADFFMQEVYAGKRSAIITLGEYELNEIGLTTSNPETISTTLKILDGSLNEIDSSGEVSFTVETE